MASVRVPVIGHKTGRVIKDGRDNVVMATVTVETLPNGDRMLSMFGGGVAGDVIMTADEWRNLDTPDEQVPAQPPSERQPATR